MLVANPITLRNSATGRHLLLTARRYHRQVIRAYIDTDGHKHGDKAEPKAPIMMRALPVGGMAMMTLAHWMRVFRVVHARLQYKNGNEWNRHQPVKRMNTLSWISIVRAENWPRALRDSSIPALQICLCYAATGSAACIVKEAGCVVSMMSFALATSAAVPCATSTN